MMVPRWPAAITTSADPHPLTPTPPPPQKKRSKSFCISDCCLFEQYIHLLWVIFETQSAGLVELVSQSGFLRVCIDIYECVYSLTDLQSCGKLGASVFPNPLCISNFLFHSRGCINILIIPPVLLKLAPTHKLSSLCPFPFGLCVPLNSFYKKVTAHGK